MLLPLFPVLAALLLQLIPGPVPQALRNSLFDQFQRWHPRAYVEAPVRIIDIDDESLEKLGQWPWPRTRIAEMVDRLSATGVAAIGFDVMFAEPDRTSPAAIAGLWQLDARLRRELGRLPDHDQALADSLHRADVVIGFAVERARAPGLQGGRYPLKKMSVVNLGEDQRHWLHHFNSAVSTLPLLEKAAKGNGALSFVPDGDGVVRRVPLVLDLAGEAVGTLSSEVLRVAQGAGFITLRSAGHMQGFTGERDNAGLGEVRIGEIRVPTTPQGEVWVHYSLPRPQRSLPAWKVFDGSLPPGELAGNIVLIGTSAQGLMDLRFSPFGLMAGVEAHAQLLEQILTEHYLERPGWATAAESMLLLLAGFAVGILALRTRALVAATVCLLVLVLMFVAAWLAFVEAGLLLDPLIPAIGILLSFIVCSLAHHFFSEREQRWIKAAFERYVSPNRVEHLISHPEDMALGGRRQECSFVFTDLAGFTGLMEKIDPAEAVSLLNDYLDEMIAIAFRHEGTLDRIVGDAVAIMFSAPVAQPDHRARALACALDMDAFASRYSQALQAKGIAFGKTRIGVHAGEVIVGNFGGRNIFDYRALGDPINTASRLEAVNKHLGTTVCISGEILRDCPEARVRPVGRLVLKGKEQPLAVFEALTGQEEKYAPLESYLAAYVAMRDGAADAAERFAALAAIAPDDPLVALHLRRFGQGESGDVMVMAEK